MMVAGSSLVVVYKRKLLSRRGETKKRRERGVPRRGETEKRIPARIRKPNCRVRTKRGGGGNQQPRGGGAPVPAPVVGAWKEVVVVPAVDETTLLLRKTKTFRLLAGTSGEEQKKKGKTVRCYITLGVSPIAHTAARKRECPMRNAPRMRARRRRRKGPIEEGIRRVVRFRNMK